MGEENGEQAASSAEPPSSGGAEEDGDENKLVRLSVMMEPSLNRSYS